MKKDELIGFVRNIVLQGEPVSDNIKPAHYKRVEQAVSYAFNGMLGQLYKEGDEGRYEIESYFVKHYKDVDVAEANGYKYVALVDVISSLPNGRGVWYVQPKGTGKPFMQMGRPQIATLRNTYAGGSIDEMVWYLGNVIQEGRRQVVLERIGDPYFLDILKVDYGVVRALESYTSEEDVYIPDGRFDILIQTAVNWFGQRQNDLINNNQ
jgi:hypothetical protein